MSHRLKLAAAAAVAALVLFGCETDRSEVSIQRDTVNGLPSVVATGTAQAQVKVQAIDYECRAIALKGQDGETHIFDVKSDSPRFNKIKEGDTIKVRYDSSLALYVVQTGQEPSSWSSHAIHPVDKSETPGIVCVHQGRIIANVESIDYKTRVVQLKPPSGKLITLTASDKLKNLDRVKAGDQVAILYREELNIDLD